MILKWSGRKWGKSGKILLWSAILFPYRKSKVLEKNANCHPLQFSIGKYLKNAKFWLQKQLNKEQSFQLEKINILVFYFQKFVEKKLPKNKKNWNKNASN